MFCLDCYSEFDDDDVAINHEYDDAWGSRLDIVTECCPFCRGECIIEIYHHCNNCDSVCTDDYIETKDGRFYCYDCYNIRQIEELA